MRILSNKKGMTLIEILLYLAIFSIVIVAVTNFGVKTVEWNKKAVSRTVLEEEAVSINRFFNETFGKASSIDEDVTKTIYDNNTGKLTLILVDTTTTVAYSLNGTTLNVQRGSGPLVSLIGNNVNVTKFKLTKVLNKGGITIGTKIEIDMNTKAGDPMSRSISTSYLIDQK